MNPILRFDAVTKVFGSGPTEVRALTGVTLDIEPGEFVAMMGPSGCGKSTLLHLAGGLETPTAGQVFIDGTNIASLNLKTKAALRRTHVGYIFQKLNLIVSLTALENVMLPLEIDGMGRKQAQSEAEATLATVELPKPWDRFPDDFSGGQQQRIAIARAIVGERRVLLADEPTGALDTVNADQVIELLASLAGRTGAAIVLVTHEPRFASWADRVIFLRDGQVVDSTPSLARNDAPTNALAGTAS